MAIFPVNTILNPASTGIIELCNVAKHINKIKADFPSEYWLDCNVILEALDYASNITEASIAAAPFPAIDIGDTQADKATKVADIWRAYPRIGLQIYFDSGNGQYQKKGQPIVIQNTPVQFPVPLISPYLNATSAVFLMGENSRLGIQVVSGGIWMAIKSPDYITITGALRFDIQVKELKQILIKSWPKISKELIANEPIKILNSKPNRRYLSLVNHGNGDIYCGFGDSININEGNLLTPKGSYTFDSEKYYTEAEFWAISPNVNGLIVGQEGLI